MARAFPIGVCVEPLFPDLPLPERIARVAALGYSTVEFWDPVGKDLAAIRRACQSAGVTVSDATVAECWGAGRLDRDPASVQSSFARTIPVLQEVGATRAIVLAGDLAPGEAPADHRRRIVENLRLLAPMASRAGITLLLEALNSLVDHKGYFLDSATSGFEIVREVGQPSVRLLYDVYHMQIMQGNIIDTVQRNIALIGHFHAAGVPGRHEVFSGELDYRHILDAIDAAGYRGCFGLEYWPTGDHEESLRRTADFLR